MQVKSKLQAFIEDMKLDSHLTRKLQEALQLHFHLHGGVCLSQLLSTAEVSRNIREDVLMYAHGNRLQVCRLLVATNLHELNFLQDVAEKFSCYDYENEL